MPVVIGGGGVERIVEINLNATEIKEFNASVKADKNLVDVVKKIRRKAK